MTAKLHGKLFSLFVGNGTFFLAVEIERLKTDGILYCVELYFLCTPVLLIIINEIANLDISFMRRT